MSMRNKELTGFRKGYLKGDFQFFHLKDQKSMEFEYHYHDFNKLIVFRSGNVTYLIEGKAYRLKPWDILLVSSSEVHRPLIDPSVPYERIIMWVNPEYLEKHSSPDCCLSTCFDADAPNRCNLLRPGPEMMRDIRHTLSHLEGTCKSTDFGSRILSNSLFMQLVVYINREYLGVQKLQDIQDVEYDENIGKVIDHINANLAGDLSIENLAASFYMSKYYLMHRFKAQTGYSIHSYIQQKRLLLANSLVKKGMPVTEICMECGFGDYSNFVRAFRKMFGMAPRQYFKTMTQQPNSPPAQPHFQASLPDLL